MLGALPVSEDAAPRSVRRRQGCAGGFETASKRRSSLSLAGDAGGRLTTAPNRDGAGVAGLSVQRSRAARILLTTERPNTDKETSCG
jgi:hypothetical protein